MARAAVREEGGVVARSVEEAEGFLRRLRGWMGRRTIDPEEAFYLPRASAVHTFFMRTPIDVVFLDGRGTVLAVRPALAPWRVAACVGAAGILELAPGRAGAAGVRVGDRLRIEEEEGT